MVNIPTPKFGLATLLSTMLLGGCVWKSDYETFRHKTSSSRHRTNSFSFS